MHRRAIDKDIATTKGLQGLITQAIIVVHILVRKKERSKKTELLISGKKWIKGIVRTTSKVIKIACKLLLERRISNKLGDKSRVLWGNFQTCSLAVQLHKTKHPDSQGPGRSPSSLDLSKWQSLQGSGTGKLTPLSAWLWKYHTAKITVDFFDARDPAPGKTDPLLPFRFN